MINHYETLGLQEGASQEEIQEAYNRLSKELDPVNNDNQEFFIEEYEKLQQAYNALYNTSILAIENGIKATPLKPKAAAAAAAPIKASDKPISKRTFKMPSIKMVGIIGVAAVLLSVAGYFIIQPKSYQLDEVVFNNDLAYLKVDMSLLNGKINDSLYTGDFVAGQKEGKHKMQYLYTGKDTLMNFAEGNFSENRYQGNWIFYHKNGNKHAEGVYTGSDGKKKGMNGVPNEGREGLWRFWYENGQLESEGNYVNDKEGLWRWWHENGQLESEGNYVNDKAEGLWRFWYENGQLEQEGNYVNDKAEGLWRNWYESGQLEQEGKWVNDKAEGLWRQWYENGQLAKEGKFVNGKQEGLWRYWLENGQLAHREKYIRI